MSRLIIDRIVVEEVELLTLGNKVVGALWCYLLVNLVGVIKDWIDVDYIEGTVLPEID